MRKGIKNKLLFSTAILGLNFYPTLVNAESEIEESAIIKTIEESSEFIEISGEFSSSELDPNLTILINNTHAIPLDLNESVEMGAENESLKLYTFTYKLNTEDLILTNNEVFINLLDKDNQVSYGEYIMTYDTANEEFILSKVEIEKETLPEVEEEILENTVEEDDPAELEADHTENLKSDDTTEDIESPLVDEETVEEIEVLEELESEKVDTEVEAGTENDEKLETVAASTYPNLSVSINSTVRPEVLSFNAPRTSEVGQSYTLSATASTTNNTLYKFWIRDDATNTWTVLRDYNSTSSFNWTPSKQGSYRLVVHVKNRDSTRDYDHHSFVDVTVSQPKLAINTFSINEGGYVGSAYSINTETNRTDDVLYKYWVHDLTTRQWTVVRDYSSNPAFNWTPQKEGRYQLVVHTKTRDSKESYDTHAFKYVNVLSLKHEISSFEVSESGHAGLPYSLTTTVKNADQAQYKYWVHDLSTSKWVVLRDYSSDPSFNWTPSKAGRYQLVVHTKDGQSTATYDDYSHKFVTVQPPVLKIESFSVNGGGHVGSNYTLETTVPNAQDSLYKYWVHDLSTGKWEVIRDYSSDQRFNWVPKKEGRYQLVVHSKNRNSQLDFDDHAFKYVNVESSSSVMKEFSVEEAKYVGGQYTINALADSGNNTLYKYYVRENSTNNWIVISDYSSNTQMNWTPSKPGGYRLVVHTKDSFSPNDYDDVSFKDITVHAPFVYQVTEYNNTFNSVLDTQMRYNPQTDKYGNGWESALRVDVAANLNPNNFIDSSVNLNGTSAESINITTSSLNVRSGPGTTFGAFASVTRNQVFTVLGSQNGWYKINVNDREGWVSGAFVALISQERILTEFSLTGKVNTSTLNVRSGPSTTHSAITQVISGQTFNLLDEQDGWYLINVNGNQGWVSGAYLDVSSTFSKNMLKFLSLSSRSGITESLMNHELRNAGILRNTGNLFIEASKLYNVNEIYLLSHALLETGHGTSRLATGVLVSEVDGVAVTPKTVYNMYGIAAFDSTALKSGSEYAYKQGWDTPEKAILGGAQWIASRYINNSTHKQDTLYKMRWNPANPGIHQYATDIGWAIKQTHTLELMVEMSVRNNSVLRFDIPVYK